MLIITTVYCVWPICLSSQKLEEVEKEKQEKKLAKKLVAEQRRRLRY